MRLGLQCAPMEASDIEACEYCPVPLLPGDPILRVPGGVIHREHLIADSPTVPAPREEPTYA